MGCLLLEDCCDGIIESASGMGSEIVQKNNKKSWGILSFF